MEQERPYTGLTLTHQRVAQDKPKSSPGTSIDQPKRGLYERRTSGPGESLVDRP